MIRLGAFRLGASIASGGMSQVWAGTHAQQGTPVAVKLITRAVESQRGETLGALFKNEVRAMAGLTHPNIVTVFDHGVVSEDAAAATEGALLPGCPYLVMELADDGCVPDGRTLAWRELRRILLALLDALSHAHARGLVHRDIKPSNLLLFGDGRIKLSDFGLALHLGTDQGDSDLVMGTPSYMAPEQFDRRRWDFGPATDLYAVGCVAFALACGDPPFGRTGQLRAIAAAHKHNPVPPLFPRSAVPDGLAGWIGCLLEKNPASRFQRAADATTSLLSLADPDDGDMDGETTAGKFKPPDTASLHTLGFMHRDMTALAAPLSQPTPASDQEPAPPTRHDQAFPASWRTPQMDRLSLGSLVAGLGLYWLRAHPVVGRDAEQDQLWQQLGRVVKQRASELIIIDGDAGVGKSHLARWLCERGHEVGAATIMTAFHNPLAGPRHGLVPMVSRLLQCAGLGRDALLAHLRATLRRSRGLDDGEYVALADLVLDRGDLLPGTGPDAPQVRFATATERYVLLDRVIEVSAQERGVIVWLDDVHWGPDALAFAQHYIASPIAATTPALFVLTARRDLLERRPAERQLCDALADHRRASRLALDALPMSSASDLVDQLLPLDHKLIERAAEWSHGNPLRAVQLVGDWVDRRLLEPLAGGFGVADTTLLRLASLAEIWTRRLEGVLRAHSDSAAVALELAGVLGQEVDAVEWSAACAVAGVAAPGALLDDLLSRNLVRAAARGTEAGWTFAHSMLCDAIEQRAHEMGRLRSHHETCATMLRGKSTSDGGERIARHLIAAGNLRDAVDPLLHAGAHTRVETGDFVLADALLAERELALQTMQCPRNDVRWGEGWLLRGRLTARRGRYDEAATWAERCERAADEHGWSALHARALLLLGSIRRAEGDTVAAERALRRAAGEALDLGGGALLADCHQELAKLLMDIGALERAAMEWNASRALLDAGGDQRGSVAALAALGHLRGTAGDFDAALQMLRDARDGFHGLGDRYGIGRCLMLMGDVARYGGDHEGADNYYMRAGKRFVALGAGDASATCELGRALCRLEAGRPEEAGLVLGAVAEQLTHLGRRQALALCAVAEMAVSAARHTWNEWDAQHARATELLEATGYVDVDVARYAELAADATLERDEDRRAREAYGIAFRQWRALGRNADVARLIEKLEALVEPKTLHE